MAGPSRARVCEGGDIVTSGLVSVEDGGPKDTGCS